MFNQLRNHEMDVIFFPLRLALLSCIFSVSPLFLSAQIKGESLEEFSRRRELEMQAFAHKQKTELDSMLSAQNRAFAKMLSGNWTRADLFPETRAYEKPKPENPLVKDTDSLMTSSILSLEPKLLEEDAVGDMEYKTALDDSPKDQENPISEMPASESKISDLDERFREQIPLEGLKFFGNNTWTPVLKNWPLHQGELSARSIENYWLQTSKFDSSVLLAYLSEQRKFLQLNPWSSFQMIQQVAKKNFDDPVNQELFVWFMMIQLGYDVRLFYGDESVFVAAAFQNKLYSRSYLEAEGKRYYLLSPRSGNRFITYPGDHENAMITMRFDGLDSGVYPSEWQQRTFNFQYQNKDYTVPLSFNVFRTEFYATVPQNDFDCYFSNPGGSSFLERLKSSLDSLLESFESMDDRIRFFHALVCLGVEYETDAQQFGYEKYCMPEEFLIYPKADCEDRTFFLNYLYRQVLKVPTIGLVYPGHMAMAVAMENPPANAAIIRYKEKDYVFCDPTYIGAAVGDIPQQYQGVTPEIVE